MGVHKRTVVCISNLRNQELTTLIHHFSNQAKVLFCGIMANVTLTYVFSIALIRVILKAWCWDIELVTHGISTVYGRKCSLAVY